VECQNHGGGTVSVVRAVYVALRGLDLVLDRAREWPTSIAHCDRDHQFIRRRCVGGVKVVKAPLVAHMMEWNIKHRTGGTSLAHRRNHGSGAPEELSKCSAHSGMQHGSAVLEFTLQSDQSCLSISRDIAGATQEFHGTLAQRMGE
jgi:hypothetical protein